MFTLIRLYITYTKTHPETGEKYVGRASGLVEDASPESADKVMKRRDSGHEKNKEGFEPGLVEKVSEDGDAIRGHEQMLIDAYRERNNCANDINGISPRNPKRKQYLAAAIAAFGDVALVTLAVFYYIPNPFG